MKYYDSYEECELDNREAVIRLIPSSNKFVSVSEHTIACPKLASPTDWTKQTKVYCVDEDIAKMLADLSGLSCYVDGLSDIYTAGSCHYGDYVSRFIFNSSHDWLEECQTVTPNQIRAAHKIKFPEQYEDKEVKTKVDGDENE